MAQSHKLDAEPLRETRQRYHRGSTVFGSVQLLSSLPVTPKRASLEPRIQVASIDHEALNIVATSNPPRFTHGRPCALCLISLSGQGLYVAAFVGGK